jgi:hypothetical protein
MGNPDKKTKYILISGGVISGIGKGIFASSLGLLLKTIGLRVTAIKIDPYMNIDAGTMSPIEHGWYKLFTYTVTKKLNQKKFFINRRSFCTK